MMMPRGRRPTLIVLMMSSVSLSITVTVLSRLVANEDRRGLRRASCEAEQCEKQNFSGYVLHHGCWNSGAVRLKTFVVESGICSRVRRSPSVSVGKCSCRNPSCGDIDTRARGPAIRTG